jgi:hypothetical protein
MMKPLLLFLTLIITAVATINAQDVTTKFDRHAYYDTMASGNLSQIDKEIEVVREAEIKAGPGFEGALLMRKSGLLKRPKDKLRFFKEGRIKMETCLLSDSTNTELRFLRLTIEEHAPKIVKYKADLTRDRLFVQGHFKKLMPVVQEAILEYSRTSKILRREDLK